MSVGSADTDPERAGVEVWETRREPEGRGPQRC